MNIRFTPGFLYCTNAARSPLFVDQKVAVPYWMRSRMLRSAPRRMSRTRRIASSDGGFMFVNQRSTSADFTRRPPSGRGGSAEAAPLLHHRGELALPRIRLSDVSEAHALHDASLQMWIP